MNQIKAALKLIFSYFKSEWDLIDYPIRYRYQSSDKMPDLGNYHAFPWIAQIVNWWAMVGCGQTKEEALENLHRNFEARRAKRPSLPRPGTRVPIEFASSVQIEEYEAIAREFFSEILGKEYDGFLITDESSLWDLYGPVINETIEYYYEKIQQKFGVDVSDLEDAKLSMIFRRIHEHQVEDRLQASGAQRQQIRKQYPILFDKLSECLHRHDPIMIPFAPKDEYDPEVGTIIPRLNFCNCQEDVLDVVHEEFVQWFGTDIAGPKSNYSKIAAEVWQIWCERETKQKKSPENE
jgi:hypothetical protein